MKRGSKTKGGRAPQDKPRCVAAAGAAAASAPFAKTRHCAAVGCCSAPAPSAPPIVSSALGEVTAAAPCLPPAPAPSHASADPPASPHRPRPHRRPPPIALLPCLRERGGRGRSSSRVRSSGAAPRLRERRGAFGAGPEPKPRCTATPNGRKRRACYRFGCHNGPIRLLLASSTPIWSRT